jgi:hypothetical protein
MNKTNLQHAIFALLIQSTIGFASGDWWAGFAAAVSFFLGREHAQREYKIYKWGQKTGRKWWKGFTGWSKDAWLDFLSPLVACSIMLAIIMLA